MSRLVTLRARTSLPAGLELDALDPAACQSRSTRQISALPVWCGSQQLALGDVFDVSGEYSDQVRIESSLPGVEAIGARMTGGLLVVEGDAGGGVGAGMTGGVLRILGSVGDDAGVAMRGGLLVVAHSAGDRLGGNAPGTAKGMSGGEILVNGSAGTGAGVRMRRGLVVIGGTVGEGAGRDMIAGTLVAGGQLGPNAGIRNKRGSIVACGGLDLPKTYRYACTYEPPFVRLLCVHLVRRREFAVAQQWMDRAYRRYCGDLGTPGRGEILELVP